MAISRNLPVAQQALGAGACCGACAQEAARPARRPISRATDRRITFAGVAFAAAFLGLAIASLALPVAERRGWWLPLHLGLAGAAGTAIGAVLPFFTAALAVAPPAAPVVRGFAVTLLPIGALLVSAGFVRGAAPLAVAGGLAYLIGLLLVAVAAFAPLLGSLGPRRRLVEGAYVAALGQAFVAVAIATAMLAGVGSVVLNWAALKPAHAWLNVFGFVSLIVAATLVHLGPTVAGTRIRPRRSALVAVCSLAAGAPIVAAGLAFGSDPVARLGALVELVGAGALVLHGLAVARDRGRWTTDPSWHRMTSWSLLAAPAWLLVTVAVLAERLVSLGASPASWTLDAVAAPLALGWVGQVLVGSWSHLLPALGPGDATIHARQRIVLGRWVTARFVALNSGVAGVLVGTLAGDPRAVSVGLVVALASMATSVGLFVMAAIGARGVDQVRAVATG